MIGCKRDWKSNMECDRAFCTQTCPGKYEKEKKKKIYQRHPSVERVLYIGVSSRRREVLLHEKLDTSFLKK